MNLRQQILNSMKLQAENVGKHIKPGPLLIGMVYRDDFIRKYGQEQVTQWEQNNQIYFVPEVEL